MTKTYDQLTLFYKNEVIFKTDGRSVYRDLEQAFLAKSPFKNKGRLTESFLYSLYTCIEYSQTVFYLDFLLSMVETATDEIRWEIQEKTNIYED